MAIKKKHAGPFRTSHQPWVWNCVYGTRVTELLEANGSLSTTGVVRPSADCFASCRNAHGFARAAQANTHLAGQSGSIWCTWSATVMVGEAFFYMFRWILRIRIYMFNFSCRTVYFECEWPQSGAVVSSPSHRGEIWGRYTCLLSHSCVFSWLRLFGSPHPFSPTSLCSGKSQFSEMLRGFCCVSEQSRAHWAEQSLSSPSLKGRSRTINPLQPWLGERVS